LAHDATLGEVNILHQLLPGRGTFTIMGRGFFDWWYHFHEAGTFFVTRQSP
jgi:hypothetical protein